MKKRRRRLSNNKEHKNNASKYKGVSWNKAARRWEARIRINGYLRFLGYFVNKIAAAQMYDVSAVIHYGRHAKLNFPLDGGK